MGGESHVKEDELTDGAKTNCMPFARPLSVRLISRTEIVTGYTEASSGAHCSWIGLPSAALEKDVVKGAGAGAAA